MSEFECCGHGVRDGCCVLCGMTPSASQSAPPAHNNWRRRLPDCWISAIRPNFVSPQMPVTEVKKRRTRRGRRGGKNRRKQIDEQLSSPSFMSNDDNTYWLNMDRSNNALPGAPVGGGPAIQETDDNFNNSLNGTNGTSSCPIINDGLCSNNGPGPTLLDVLILSMGDNNNEQTESKVESNLTSRLFFWAT